jgi:hypothetical protein
MVTTRRHGTAKRAIQSYATDPTSEPTPIGVDSWAGGGSARRRRFLFLPVLVAAFTAPFFVAGAQAVHHLEFQLDGDVLASTTTNVGGNTQAKDWNSFFDSSGNVIPGSL